VSAVDIMKFCWLKSYGDFILSEAHSLLLWNGNGFGTYHKRQVACITQSMYCYLLNILI